MFSASKTSGPSGYNINNSLRFRSSASAYLTRTLGSASSRTTWTYSFWIKRGLLGGTYYILSNGNGNANNTEESLYFESTDQLTFINVTQNVAVNWAITTTQVFRDPSAWYHFVIAVDTTQATAANRIKFYVNGSQITSFSSASYPAQNANTTQGASGLTNEIGRRAQVSSNYFDGYYTEFNFVTGQQLTPSSFGSTNSTTGVWQPKAYTGTYGTNGFYLKFSDIATTSGSNAGLGKDFSGNGNYWNTNNISVTAGATYDAMTDSPTLTSATVANYATLNYIDTNTASSISGANLNWVDAGGIDREIRGTIGVSSGKYYWEVVLTSSNTSHVGVDTLNSTLLTDYLGSTSTSWSIYLATGNKRNAGSNTSYGSSLAANDIMMCALDMDNGKIWWGKNGTWFASGDPAAGTNAAFTNLSGYTIAFAATPRSSCSVNFGQRPFSYTPPTGFNRLNTYNLSDSTIKKGNKYMDATLWTGGQSSPFSVTNAGSFKPDLVWAKYRTAAASHRLYDSVRGSGIALYSNDTSAEGTEANTGVSAFQTAGFQITNSNGVAPYLNDTSQTYVGWQWQAGQGTTSSNTSGSITSTVSVNATAGFSIVTYTGTGANATVGHGLGVAPKFIIVKRRNTTGNWQCWHTSFTGTQYITLNLTGVVTTNSTVFNGTPTSTIFNIGTDTDVNASTSTYVAYCWAEISGFSKFGSYVGNNSTNGPFVYCGFRPKFILIKDSSAVGNWVMEDTSRSTYNQTAAALYPNLSNAEDTGNAIDILSNGFKVRASASAINQNASDTFIYAAFAESPFKVALAR